MAAYTVLPLDPNNVAWLQAENLAVPNVAGPSRYPTVNELKHAMSLLANFRVWMQSPNPADCWNVIIDRPDQARGDLQTILSVTAYQGDNVPHGFWFEEGWPPVVVGLLKSLAASAGPLVVLAADSGAPAVVEATSDVQTVLKTWRHTAGQYA